ncbi:MAG TPA: ComEC/Rec2 family competence protein [Pyrinomonadaceae bacterium]|nr:ComEC/Rec2 family competence protein [Pyrinomonadaceae bacterium]
MSGAVVRRQSFNPHPLALLAAAFAAGAWLAHLFGAQAQYPVAACALASTAAFVAWLRDARGAATAALVLAYAGAGAALAVVELRPPAEARLRSLYENGLIASGDPVEVTGTIERIPESSPDGLFFSLAVESVRAGGVERPCRGRVELFAPARGADERGRYEALELRRGARVSVAARLTRAARYRNPGVETLDEHLDRRGSEARAVVKSPLLVERLDDRAVFLPLHWLDAWRRRALGGVDALVAPDAAGVLKAAMFGDRRGLTRETAERFREGGTFHVLVVSGLHVTLIGGLVWGAARLLTRRRPWQWLAAAVAVWGFALAVGAESSVVRAALMLTAASLAPAVGRRAGALNALGGAALALLAWRPSSLFDPSFQLTFLSVLAIVAVALPLLSRLREVGEWRPTRETPRPPDCPEWFRAAGELLFWREARWRREQERATHSYRLFKNPLASRLERLRVQPALRWACSILVVSACVQAALLPLLVLYFHRLPLAAPLLNLWVGPLLAAGCASALAALLLWAAGAAAASALASLAEAATLLAARGVDPFAEAGLASLRLPEYSGAASAVYVLYFVPLAVFAVTLAGWRPLGTRADEPAAAEGKRPADPPAGGERRSDEHGAGKGRRSVEHGAGRGWRRGLRVIEGWRSSTVAAGVALAAAGALIVLHPFSAPPADGRLRVDFLDVGQGDSALVTMPDGATLLVDGGGRQRFGRAGGAAGGARDDDGGAGDGEGGAEVFEPDARGVGDRVVSEFLWHRGLDRVNYVVATHADADHVRGLGDVLANFKVDAALVGRAPASDAEFTRFAAAAERARVPVYLLARGDVLRFGAATVEVLWPPAGDAAAPSANDDSIVLRLRFGRRTILLTGDIEERAEAALAGADGDALACDALKVAHHGSRSSTTERFLAAARPALAIVPAPLDSPHGHPHPEVLARLRARGARVLTTGESGTITVSTDGEDLRVETFVRGR